MSISCTGMEGLLIRGRFMREGGMINGRETSMGRGTCPHDPPHDPRGGGMINGTRYLTRCTCLTPCTCPRVPLAILFLFYSFWLCTVHSKCQNDGNKSHDEGNEVHELNTSDHSLTNCSRIFRVRSVL